MQPALFLFHSPIIPPNSEKETPLYLAACNGHLETVRALLRQGATVLSDELLYNISRIAQEVVAAPSDDLLRLRENWNAISFALRRALLMQRNDADQPLTPRLTALLRSQDFRLEDWRAVNAHLGITSIEDIHMLPIEEVEFSLLQASISAEQHIRAVRLWLHHMLSSGE
jgi:ankyrin repeat protein